MQAIEFVNSGQPIEVLVGIRRILKISQPPDAGEEHVVQRRGKPADADEEPIEIAMAGSVRQRHKALFGLAELCRRARRLLCLLIRRPERIQAWLDTSAA